MTEHPAAPTPLAPLDQLFNEVDERFGRNVARFVDARLDAALADARAAARKEVERLAAEWETAAKRIGDRALMGDPAVSVAVAQSLQSCARAILDSLSTNTREEHGDHES